MKFHFPAPVLAVGTLSLIITTGTLSAQLAITEVMSSASTNLGTTRVVGRADYWELTNFGTNTIDLTGCRFSDEAGISEEYAGEDEALFGGRLIGPGESIIFFQFTRDVCTNASQFRAWWGEARLPENLQLGMYTGRGFSSSADAVQLWQWTAGTTTLVQRVPLYEARRGFSFTYDRATGAFGSLNSTEEGAFKAVETDDVGSPGFTTGPVPLAIQEQPRDVTVDAGSPASFRIQVQGLPIPRFQWRREGVPINHATESLLAFAAVEPEDAGTYTVLLENGLTNLISAPAVLQVNTNPSPPRITQAPADLVVTPGQTAVFQVRVRGFPLPAIQWEFQGAEIPGATSSTLEVTDAGETDSGTYSVRITNPLGATNAAATLSVRPRPNLKITEMMGSRSTNSTIGGRGDWWELANLDSEPVNLRGYRFDDRPAVLEGSVTITNDLILHPGEVVLFIQDMTPEHFTEWWGVENLPEHLQFVRYSGNGISAEGDSITLWNATARDPLDYIAQASYVHLNPDFTPVRGLSLTFWCDDYIEFGTASILGVCGAVQAARSDDIGSPGYLVNHPTRPRAVRISWSAQGVQLTWKVEPNRVYELLRTDDLQGAEWVPAGPHWAASDELTITDTTAANTAQRFYRLVYLPPLP